MLGQTCSGQSASVLKHVSSSEGLDKAKCLTWLRDSNQGQVWDVYGKGNVCH